MTRGLLLIAVLTTFAGCGAETATDRHKRYEVELQRIYEHGRGCAKVGVPATANPQIYSPDREKWLNGWIEGNKGTK